MIFRVSNPETGEESVMVIDRANRMCVIIKLETDHITSLVAVARAMNVPNIIAIIDMPSQFSALVQEGWSASLTRTMVEFKLHG